MPNTHDVTDEREAVGGEEGAAQQLNQILASGLPPLYRRAYRILGNTADAEDAVQDALLAIPIWTSSEDSHKSPLG